MLCTKNIHRWASSRPAATAPTATPEASSWRVVPTRKTARIISVTLPGTDLSAPHGPKKSWNLAGDLFLTASFCSRQRSSQSCAALNRCHPGTIAVMLASFHFGWRGGFENSSIRENNASTNFATLWYRSVFSGNLMPQAERLLQQFRPSRRQQADSGIRRC